MGIDFQLHRASVDISKGYRQFQKADSARSKDKLDSAASNLEKGLNYFASAQDHLLKAEDVQPGTCGLTHSWNDLYQFIE